MNFYIDYQNPLILFAAGVVALFVVLLVVRSWRERQYDLISCPVD